MAKEVEVTETKTNTFRLFNKIEYNPVSVPESWGIDATFYVRPMTNTEKALFGFEEEKRRNGSGVLQAMAKNNVTFDDYKEVDGENVPKTESMEKLVKAFEDIEIDVEIESRYLEAVKKIAVDCTEKVDYEGDTMEFTGELYEAINGASGRMWLLEQVKSAGELTGAERIGL